MEYPYLISKIFLSGIELRIVQYSKGKKHTTTTDKIFQKIIFSSLSCGFGNV